MKKTNLYLILTILLVTSSCNDSLEINQQKYENTSTSDDIAIFRSFEFMKIELEASEEIREEESEEGFYLAENQETILTIAPSTTFKEIKALLSGFDLNNGGLDKTRLNRLEATIKYHYEGVQAKWICTPLIGILYDFGFISSLLGRLKNGLSNERVIEITKENLARLKAIYDLFFNFTPEKVEGLGTKLARNLDFLLEEDALGIYNIYNKNKAKGLDYLRGLFAFLAEPFKEFISDIISVYELIKEKNLIQANKTSDELKSKYSIKLCWDQFDYDSFHKALGEMKAQQYLNIIREIRSWYTCKMKANQMDRITGFICEGNMTKDTLNEKGIPVLKTLKSPEERRQDQEK